MTDLAKKTSKAELAETIFKLAESVKALEAKVEALIPAPVAKAPAPVVVESTYPVPSEYREIVSTVLNASFGIEITPMSDVPSFQFTIVVPQSYSNAGKPYWDTFGGDKRMRVVSYAEGVNGVREWSEKVFNNFDQDTRTRIALDRIQVRELVS